MHNRKRLNTFVVVFMAIALILAGCSSNSDKAGSSTGTGSEPSNAGSASSSNGDDPSKGGDTDSGNSEKRITIELMEGGWVNTPTDEQDPFKKWISDKFNVDFKLTNIAAPDFESKLLTRFASEPPDIIFSGDRSLLQKLYNQGVLLDDWTPLLDKVPTLAGALDDAMKVFVSQDGKMIALPKQPDVSNWSFKIRKDWLDKLSLQMPTTDEELFEVLKQFTFNDPDGNGKNDTWGISSAGEGKGLNVVGNLEAMYGPGGFSVSDNKVDHSILNGTHQQFLEFMSRLYKEKVIDPDWYTQSWGQKGAKLVTDKIGIDWYPGVLVSEYDMNDNGSGKAAEMWTNLPMPKGAEIGGKHYPSAPVGGMLSISAKAAKDPEKLDRILRLIDGVAYPNEGYWALRWGVGITDEKVVDLDGGAKFFSDHRNDPDNYRVKFPGAWDYGTWIATNRDGVLQSTAKEAGKIEQKMLELDQQTMNAPTYQNFESFLQLDPQLISDVSKLQQQFDITYILGKDTDYEAFKKAWLAAGGQQLLDSTEQQFKEFGFIK